MKPAPPVIKIRFDIATPQTPNCERRDRLFVPGFANGERMYVGWDRKCYSGSKHSHSESRRAHTATRMCRQAHRKPCAALIKRVQGTRLPWIPHRKMFCGSRVSRVSHSLRTSGSEPAREC